jgi:ATP-dependent Lon protease
MDGFKKIELPPLVPVLPVRNTVLFPNAAVPLIVGRSRSIQAIKEAQRGSDILLVVTQKDGSKEEPLEKDLYRTGVVCLLSKITQVENESYQLIANGLFRFEILEFVDQGTVLTARGVQLPELSAPQSTRTETLSAEIKQLGKSILTLAAVPGSDALVKLFGQIQDPEHIADLCCTFVNLSVSTKQELLEMQDLEKRLQILLDHMVKEKEKLLLQNEIQSKMMERLSKDQRDHLLREQIRTIHEELGEESNLQDDFAKKIEEAGLPSEAKKVAKEELSRLSVVQRSSPEYHVIRTYLDWILSMPWQKTSATESSQINLDQARKVLDEDHFGIEKVKSRILQFLAVTKLKKDLKGPILCLLGPPGVGKTSMGKSIAKALGRTFIRTSLGGVRDEAEIRGHRRTYIGAMPGRIVQSLKRVGVKDPLIMLDEIDKIGTDFRGDPASALLEVLDPEQNHAFVDHYLDVPFDLSRVFFITTANVMETIPPALRDRMEIIEMTSYSKAEKLEIAVRHLVPKLLEDHGMTSPKVELPRETLELVIDAYTREAGVRNLTREIAHLCRAAAEELARENPAENVILTPEKVESILGPRKFFTERIDDRNRPGVVTGLAWTPVGGEILNIEVTKMEGKGNLLLTGHLGDVMKESAQIGVSLLRSSMGRQIPFRFDKTDFHVHVPSGAIPKDGPSAGVAIFLSLASLLENKPISSKLAFTGELTLRGTVLPVGGIKEKVLAAHRAGIETVVLPERNQGDLVDVSPDVRNQMKFHFVKDVYEVLPIAGLAIPLIIPGLKHEQFVAN